MMFFKSESRQKDQRGFTIIELVVSIAIFAIISSGVTFAVVQMLSVHASSTNRITAIRQVQNAGYRVSQDAQQAQTVSFVDDLDTEVIELLTLSWIDWGGTENVVVYTVNNRGEFVRIHYHSSLVDTTIVSRFITEASCLPDDPGDPNNRLFDLTVTATVGGFQQVSETRVYEIIPRPGL